MAGGPTEAAGVDEQRAAEIAVAEDSGLRAYTPGLSLGESARAALTRFLPGTVVGLVGSFGLLTGFPGPAEWIEAALLLGVGAVTLTAGFAAGLEVIRRHLYPDARITGRRSVVAGLMAPVAVIATLGVAANGSVGTLTWFGLLLGVPAVLAILLFFAWLTPTPEEIRDPEFRDDPVGRHLLGE